MYCGVCGTGASVSGSILLGIAFDRESEVSGLGSLNTGASGSVMDLII